MKGSTATLVLTVLKGESLYGYALIKEIELRSNGIFEFKEGTLYPILHDLEDKECVESFWEVYENRRRKYYRITKKGLKLLEEKRLKWQVFSKAMENVLAY